ncbi:hypothetical protein DPMN_105524 [Dreissena polymorpha]|uniref:Uncharacterized protein n=1 Tax=Dreissena polymorpha TaxID=45954 RepID=A0A9D4QHK6_DREPO|nr:hypothetical protein DPMN_105524 [Dreissena polymorpha]
MRMNSSLKTVVAVLMVSLMVVDHGFASVKCRAGCMETYHACILPCQDSPMHLPQTCNGKPCHDDMQTCLRTKCNVQV